MHVISANRLADGIVVYMGREGAWSERLSQAKVFTAKAEAELALLSAQGDGKRNVIVEPSLVEVRDDPGGVRPVSLRESIRALGPTIDFLPRSAPALQREKVAGSSAESDRPAHAHGRACKEARGAREHSLESA